MPEQEFSTLEALFANILKNRKKPTAYNWQELALRVIKDLGIPADKKSSVFQLCKKYPQEVIERAMNDTKELCKNGEGWRYFFKILANLNKKKPE